MGITWISVYPRRNAEETLARLVNRYAEQDHKKDIFMTDPSMRAVGVGHTVMGQTAEQLLHAQPVTGLGKLMHCSTEKDLDRCGRAPVKQDWSSPCRQPCSTSPRNRVHAGCGFVRRFR